MTFIHPLVVVCDLKPGTEIQAAHQGSLRLSSISIIIDIP